MKLSGNTKITIKVPKRLYESIKRQLREGDFSRDDARSDMSGADTPMEEVPEEFFQDLEYHFEGDQEATDFINNHRDEIEAKVKNWELDPETAIEYVESNKSGEEAVTMEELNEAVKQIKAKKKMAEAKKKKEADAKKKMTEAKKKADEEKKAKEKKATDAKKKVAEAKKK